MKNCTILLIVTWILYFSPVAYSQTAKELVPGYYVVVGAYAKSREAVAQNYAEALRKKGHQAEYGYNASRNLYFVYLSYFTDLKSSLREMTSVRKDDDFKDAWVRVVSGKIEPQTATPAEQVKAAKPADTTTPPATPVTTSSEDKKEAPPVTVVNSDPADTITVSDNPEIKQYSKMTLGNTEVFLSLYNGRNNKIVDGEVKVINTETSKQIVKVKGNEYLILPDPKSKSGQLTLICEAFGYRKVQEEINYPFPLADTVKPHVELMGTTMVINFEMVRYHKGDIAVLYNVYFYNDAAVMSPESKFELNSLLDMMKESATSKIRLHGHTNGNYHGKIVKLGPNKNFFSLEGSVSSIGSAKDLSYSRAEVIKEYLVANGIGADRVEIKAWGGKRPIYDKHSANAKRNVRVEVEILEE